MSLNVFKEFNINSVIVNIGDTAETQVIEQVFSLIKN